jgi:hypothetical protein
MDPKGGVDIAVEVQAWWSLAHLSQGSWASPSWRPPAVSQQSEWVSSSS